MKNVLSLAASAVGGLLPLCLVFAAYTTIGVSTAIAQNTATITTSIAGGATTFTPGSYVTYSIKYTTPAPGPYNTVSITDQLPTDYDYTIPPSVSTNADFPSYTFNATTGVITWGSVANAPVGATRELTITAKLKTGTLPNGKTVSDNATITANGTAKASNVATFSIVATNVMTVTKTKSSGGYTTGNTVYSIKVANTGDMNNTAVTVVDTLPATATYVSASNSGVYNAAKRTITWSNITTNTGVTTSLTATVTYNTVQTSVTNKAIAMGTPAGGTATTYNLATVTHGVTVATATTKLSVGKKSSLAYVDFGVEPDFYFTINNSGTTDVTTAVITDPVPVQVNVTSIYTPFNANFPNISVKLEYATNGGTTYTTIGTYTARTVVAVSSLNLPTTSYVSAIRWTYLSAIPAGYNLTTAATSAGFKYTVRTTGRDNKAVAYNSTVKNTATYNYDNSGSATAASISASFTVSAVKAQPEVNKQVLGATTSFNPGDVITYRLRLQNVAAATDTLQNPTLADLLPAQLEYVPNSWVSYGTRTAYTATTKPYVASTSWGTALSTSTSANVPVPTFTTAPIAGGLTKLVWYFDYENPTYNYTGRSPGMEPNTLVYVEFKAKVRYSVAPGAVPNVAYVTSPAPIDTKSCNTTSPDTYDIDLDGNTTEILGACNPVNVTVSSAAQLDSKEYVKGTTNTGWVIDGHTVPGGNADYRLVVKNTGNVPMKNIKFMDILPYIGDKYLITDAARNTTWAPVLTSAVSAPAGVTTYYSTQTNPCRGDFRTDNGCPNCAVTAAPAGCVAADWSAVVPSGAGLQTIHALKFDFGSLVLNPNDSIALIWNMTAPLGSPVDQKAWNSFAYVATNANTNIALLPSEPAAVSIIIDTPNPSNLGNYVWVDTNHNGINDEPASAGINGVAVELYKADANGVYTIVDSTRTINNQYGNPGYYLFPNLAEGNYRVHVIAPWDKDVTEKPTNESTTNASRADNTGWMQPVYLNPTGTTIQKSNLTQLAGLLQSNRVAAPAGGTTPPAQLPIKALYFHATLNNCHTDLEWATATEENNHQFLLERSTNGQDFATIATVEGAGNSTDARYYNYTDETPAPYNYYRLVQVDNDGKLTIVGTVIVDASRCFVTLTENTLEVFPNPATSGTMVNVRFAVGTSVTETTTATTNGTVLVMNSIGTVVSETQIVVNAGTNQAQIETANFVAGVYQVAILNEGKLVSTKQLVVLR